jgi:hypothetical protein
MYCSPLTWWIHAGSPQYKGLEANRFMSSFGEGFKSGLLVASYVT